MTCCTRSLIIAGFSILIDLTNIFEQVFIYLLIYWASVDSRGQEIFFYIIVSISGLSMTKSLVKNKRQEILISAFIEISEFITYVVLHKTSWKDFALNTDDIYQGTKEFFRKNVVLVIATPCVAAQIICLIILYIAATPLTDNTESFAKRLKYMIIEMLIFTIYSVPQSLLLYVQPTSRFRSFFYEGLTVLTFFGGSIDLRAIHWIVPSAGNSETEQSKLYLAWIKCVRFSNKFVLLPMLTITTMVFSGQELAGTTQKPLPSFDRGVIIFTIVCYSLVGIYVAFWWCVGIGRISHALSGSSKVAPHS